jgi:hypothetical protein
MVELAAHDVREVHCTACKVEQAQIQSDCVASSCAEQEPKRKLHLALRRPEVAEFAAAGI